MKVAIVRYNAGNTVSVVNALSRLGVDPIVTDVADELRSADKVIFPGVGEASSAMSSLKAAGLNAVIPQLRQPLLGVCLGMQLLCTHSEENDTECLAIIPAKVIRMKPDGLKVPHIGWNTIDNISSPIFEGIEPSSYMYFVHGYSVEVCEAMVASTTYGQTFAAAVAKDNFYGVQFHPEKSGASGSRVLENFLNL